MERTLIIVPKMLSREEIKSQIGKIPMDFDETSKEFWDYIEEKLTLLILKIKKIYITVPIEEIKRQIATLENGECSILKKLIKNNSELMYVQEPSLVAEVKSWFEMTKTMNNQEEDDEIGESFVYST